MVGLLLLALAAQAQQALSPPRLIASAPAQYPAGATGAARVVLQLDIDATGGVSNVSVVGAPQPPFDAAALDAARALRFEPARMGDKPVAVRIQYAVNFEPPRPRETPPQELPVNLSGVVRERGTRRRLEGIEVAAGDRTAVTDRQGRFEIRGAPVDAAVVISAPNYERFSVREHIDPGKRLEVEYRLQPLFSSPYEATVQGERERRELSRTTITTQEIAVLPGTGGDPLKVVEDLPGVARTSPIGGGALVIRGSKPGDSLVYLDGLEIPLLFHFAAISATINPDLLEAVDYIPGNFSAYYGDLTGGLVEVRTRKLRDEPHGYANVNLLEASALLETAIPGVPGLRVAIAGRRSYIDYILRAAVPSSTDFSLTVAPRYYDAQLKVDYQRGANSFTFLALTDDDKLGLVVNRPAESDPNLSGNIDAETGFTQFRLKHEYRSGDFSVRTVGMFERLHLLFDVGTTDFTLDGHDTYLRSTLEQRVSDAVTVAGGIDVTNRRVTVGARFRQSFLLREGNFNEQGPRPDDATITVAPQLFNRFAPGAWVEARLTPAPGLTVTPGVRADAYHYGFAEPNTTYTITPRLSVRWELNDRLALKAGLGTYSEGARNGDAARPFGNPYVNPERATQVTLGVEGKPVPGVFASVEGFYKRLSDLIVRTDAVTNGVPDVLDNAGTGRVFGLEVLVRKELTERLFGWIAYTLSRSDRIDRPGLPRRLFDYDQTHNLTAVGSYKLGNGWQLGARLRIISGNPDTPVLGSRYLANFDAYLPIYGVPNSLRLPLFNQLDVRLDKTWTYDAWELDAYLDVLNVYDHRSIEGSVYSYDFAQHDFFRGLPVVPTLGVKGSF